MNIAIGMRHFEYGGMERLSLNLASELTRRGHRFHFLNARSDSFQMRFRELGEACHFREPGEIRDFFKSRAIDVVQVSNVNDIPELAFDAGVPGIVERTDGFSTAFMFDKSYVNGIVASTRSLHRELSLRYPDREHRLIYNGVDSAGEFDPDSYDRSKIRNELGFHERDVVLGFHGRVAPEKCVDRLIEWFSLVAKRAPQARLVILGDEWPRAGILLPALKQLVQRLGVTERIRFLPGSEFPGRIVRSFDIGVLVSGHWKQSIQGKEVTIVEGISNAVLETMAMRHPVVATASGDNEEVVREGDTGHLIPIHNRDRFVEAVLGLVSNREARDAMGANARHLIEEKFSIRAMADQYEELYNLLSNSVLSGAIRRRTAFLQALKTLPPLDSGKVPQSRPYGSRGEKVLIIRSARPEQLERAMARLASSPVDVLLPPVKKGEPVPANFTAPIKGVSCTYSYCSGIAGIRYRDIPSSMRREIKRQSYDRCLVLFNNPDGQGYGRVIHTARRLVGRHISAFTIRGEFLDFPPLPAPLRWVAHSSASSWLRWPARLAAEAILLFSMMVMKTVLVVSRKRP